MSIFSILNHPGSFKVYYFCFGVFVSLYCIIFRFSSINSNFVDGQNNSKHHACGAVRHKTVKMSFSVFLLFLMHLKSISLISIIKLIVSFKYLYQSHLLFQLRVLLQPLLPKHILFGLVFPKDCKRVTKILWTKRLWHKGV